jgi:hypothetical protein
MSHDNCPGCLDHYNNLTPEDRARIPLREASHKWRDATKRLFELVKDHGWNSNLVLEQEAVLDVADDALALAARTFASSFSDEEISALEDIKDNLHVLSEGDDISPHRALIDKLLAGRSTRGRQTKQEG